MVNEQSFSSTDCEKWFLDRYVIEYTMQPINCKNTSIYQDEVSGNFLNRKQIMKSFYFLYIIFGNIYFTYLVLW